MSTTCIVKGCNKLSCTLAGYCFSCKNKRNAYYRQRTLERRQKGLCTVCGNARYTKYIICHTCRLKLHRAKIKRQNKKRKMGCCIRCGKHSNQRDTCRKCLDKFAKQSRARYKSNPRIKKPFNELKEKRYRERREARICARCKTQLNESYAYTRCEDCRKYLAMYMRQWRLIQKQPELRDVFQRFR